MRKPLLLFLAPRWLAAASLILAGAGCTVSHTAEVGEAALQRVGLTNQLKVSRVHSFILPAGSSVYITYPMVHAESQQPKPRLHTRLQIALLDSGSRYGLAAVAGPYRQPLAEALLQAQLHGSEFLFSSYLTDRRNGEADDDELLQLVVNIYDVRSRSLVDTIAVTAERGALKAGRRGDLLMAASAQAVVESIYRQPNG